jgi:hypothetical protein
MGLREGTILAKMARLRLSRQVLARIAHMREGSVCRGLKSIEPLTNQELLHIDRVLNDLETLQTLVVPFELPISNVFKLQILLNRFRDGDLVQILNPAVAAELAAEIGSAR